ncbi:spore coat protein [Bacillus halotolerans]|nr:spore coat protein [Bacillus halotolerans]
MVDGHTPISHIRNKVNRIKNAREVTLLEFPVNYDQFEQVSPFDERQPYYYPRPRPRPPFYPPYYYPRPFYPFYPRPPYYYPRPPYYPWYGYGGGYGGYNR